MESIGLCSSSSRLASPTVSASSKTKKTIRASSLFIQTMASQKPSSARTTITNKKGTKVFPVGEPNPRQTTNGAPPVKLLSNVEKLRLLSKAEKAGLLSAAEKAGFSLSTVERIGLLSKAEEFGVLSAATDPGTPGTLLTLSLGLLVLGPAFVLLVPEDYTWEVIVQVLVALVCVVGGPAAFAASNFVANLQRSS